MLDAQQARHVAASLLAESLPRRWAHTQGVAATARRIAPILGADADLLEAAAWLHDIGYAPPIATAGFHPLDGARYLRDHEHADAVLCGLVAYHTGAIYEASERGLAEALTGEFTAPPSLLGRAITYCDITTSPDGTPIDVAERVADVQSRYGPEHPVSKSVRAATATYLESVDDIERRLAAPPSA